MTTKHVFRLRNPALLMALAAVFPVLSYAAAANVDFSIGGVTAVNAVGVQRPLTRGAEISNGDTIRTGDGRAQLRFSDGAMVSLQPQTEFRIDNYQYAGKDDGQEKGFFSLLKGGLRTITGLIGRSNRDNYRVTTSVATIGIRGTEWAGGLNGDNLDVATGEGSVIVCNDQGCVVLSAGEAGGVIGNGPPRRRHTRPHLPPAPILEGVQPIFSSGDLGIGQSGSQLLTGTQTYATVYGNIDPFCCSGNIADKGVGIGTINASGALTDFEAASGGSAGVDLGAGNIVVSQGNDGIVAWGRWIDNGSGFSGSLSGGEGGVLHYVVGIPTTDSQAALGGSSGNYTLLGGGVTGSTDGAGSITSASMSVDFGLAKVTSLAVGMNVGANCYALTESNLPISGFGTAAGVTFSSGTGSVSGGGCSGVCGASISGAFFGAGALRAGVSFYFSDSQDIAGAVVLKK